MWPLFVIAPQPRTQGKLALVGQLAGLVWPLSQEGLGEPLGLTVRLWPSGACGLVTDLVAFTYGFGHDAHEALAAVPQHMSDRHPEVLHGLERSVKKVAGAVPGLVGTDADQRMAATFL